MVCPKTEVDTITSNVAAFWFKIIVKDNNVKSFIVPLVVATA